MKKYFIGIVSVVILLAVIVIANNHSSVKPDNCADHPDYVYWPMVIDSTKLRVNVVEEYYKKIDTLNSEMKVLKNYKNKYEWRIYYQIHIKYKEMEIISRKMHPDRAKYYAAMQKLYLRIADDLRKFKQFERVIERKYKFNGK